jgi:bacillolysin
MFRRRVGSSFAVLITLVASGLIVRGEQPADGPRRSRIAATMQSRSTLRSWDTTIDSMRRSGELVLRKVRTDTLINGVTHERYDQYASGLRVVGAEVSRQLDRGVTESIFGELYNIAEAPEGPTLSEEDARRILQRLSRRELPPDRPVELVIFPKDDGGYTLAYRAHVWTDDGWMHTFIDGASGQVLRQYDDLQTQAAVGTATGVLGDTKKISTRIESGRYFADDVLRPPVLITLDMQGDYLRVASYLDGLYPPANSDIASDSDNVWTDGANVDAHVHLGWTYDYYYKRFGREGLDDRNAPIFAVAHPARRSDLFTLPFWAQGFIDNAFWCGGCGPNGRGAMVFGEGLPGGVTIGGYTIDYLAGGLDVVAHEPTHGLTDYSSQLVYLNESGALNEAFSDILGTSVEFMYQSPGSGPRQADYLIGEDVFRPGGIRSAANPGIFGDPDHYSRRYMGTEDNGGVHTNSTIASHAFYLAIEGGVNRTSGLQVTGVGAANRAQIEKVFYRAFVLLLPSNATFSTARSATIQAARDLYGNSSAAERAVTEAWTAVGVN